MLCDTVNATSLHNTSNPYTKSLNKSGNAPLPSTRHNTSTGTDSSANNDALLIKHTIALAGQNKFACLCLPYNVWFNLAECSWPGLYKPLHLKPELTMCLLKGLCYLLRTSLLLCLCLQFLWCGKESVFLWAVFFVHLLYWNSAVGQEECWEIKGWSEWKESWIWKRCSLPYHPLYCC